MVFDFDDLAAAENLVQPDRSTAEECTKEVALRVVLSLSGEDLCSVTASLATNIRALKACIAQRAQISVLEQRLVVGCRRLDDDELLGDVIDVSDPSPQVSVVRMDPVRARAIEDLKQSRRQLCSLDDHLRDDPEVVMAALDSDRLALRFAGHQARAHKLVVLRAVRRNGMALQHASEELQGDAEVVHAAVCSAPSALQFASGELRRLHWLVLVAVWESGDALRHTELRGDREVVLAAVQQDGLALEHADALLRDDVSVVLAAVRSRGMALRHAGPRARNSREIVRVAVQSSCGAAVEFAGEPVRHDREVMLAAVLLEPLMLQHAPVPLLRDREVVLAAVSSTGLLLAIAAEPLRRDREVVLAAVRDHGLALQHAAGGLQADREVVLAAVEQDGAALQFASEGLRSDREVVLAAVGRCSNALRFATAAVLGDSELVLAAISREVGALRFAAATLMEDSEFRARAQELGAFEDEASEEFLMVGSEAVQALLAKESVVLVDARATPEFDKSHIARALSLPPAELKDAPLSGLIEPLSTVVVYSDNGLAHSRCVFVARALRRAGLVPKHQVLRLAGGLNEWKAKGFPVEGDPHTMFLGKVKPALPRGVAKLLHEMEVGARLRGRERGSAAQHLGGFSVVAPGSPTARPKNA